MLILPRPKIFWGGVHPKGTYGTQFAGSAEKSPKMISFFKKSLRNVEFPAEFSTVFQQNRSVVFVREFKT